MSPLDQVLSDPRVPEAQARIKRLGGLASRADLARRWGVSRQRVHQLAREPGFPAPAAHVNGQPVWFAAAADQGQFGDRIELLHVKDVADITSRTQTTVGQGSRLGGRVRRRPGQGPAVRDRAGSAGGAVLARRGELRVRRLPGLLIR